jgi:Protein of unknown function (DUF3099)
VKDSQRDDTPVLITEAAPSYDDQLKSRKRRYSVMMALRIPFLVAAAACYQIWWLALLLVLLSIPLPWMAVLIANDRPPRRSEAVNRYRTKDQARQLESRDHPVIDG